MRPHARFVNILTKGLLPLVALLSACNNAHISPSAAGAAFQGKVIGGQQPIAGAVIQLYAVGTTGDGSAATPLLTLAVTSSDGTGVSNSNANAGNGLNTYPVGFFSITSDYTCPTSSTYVYLTATQGNPGFGSNNPQSAEMVALGQCGTLLSNLPYITVNEVTTIGSVAALYPYMTGFSAMGSGSSDIAALENAFTTADEYMNPATGVAPGPALPANYYASTNELYALANSIAACINTSGGSYNDHSACGNLFYYTKPSSSAAATDTIGALIQIGTNPTNQVGNIYGLTTPAAPFPSTLTGPPVDWSLPILQIPSTPAFSPIAGTYTAVQTVTISDTAGTAVIYYTTDGSTPTTSSSVYSSPVTVGTTETLNAIAVQDGRLLSSEGTAAYTLNLPAAATPTFSPAGGTYATAQVVNISDSTGGASIFYTLDGSTPTTGSTPYTAAIDVSATETIRAIVTAPGYTASGIGSAAYTISESSGYIYAYAGNGNVNYCCDGSPGNNAKLFNNTDAAVDSYGNLYIVDNQNNRIRKVDGKSGVITTILGDGNRNTSGDGGLAVSAETSHPTAIAIDSSDNIYISESDGGRIRKITAATGYVNTIAGGGGSYNEGGAATTVSFNGPASLAVDASGNVYICDEYDATIREYVVSTGKVNTVAGTYNSQGYGGDGGAATSAMLQYPSGIALDSNGNIYIADTNNDLIREVTVSNGKINSIAGQQGAPGISPDGTVATAANLYYPDGVWVDASNNVYIADPGESRVRKILSSTNKLATVAGNGTVGYNGDGIAATTSELSQPDKVTLDSSGNVYITDSGNDRVRKVTVATGIISTVAGTGTLAYGGDGGPAVSAGVGNVERSVVDSSGNLYFADFGDNRIRMVNATSGIISTVAGNGVGAYAGDGGQATAAEIYQPQGVALDSSGNLYIADWGNGLIRMVNHSTGVITTVAGGGTNPGGCTGSIDGRGDGCTATNATLSLPIAVTVDTSGNLYIVCNYDNQVRFVDASTGIISIFAGDSGRASGNTGDGSAATSAKLSNPYDVKLDTGGNVYIADQGNNRIRVVNTSGNINAYAGNASGTTGSSNGTSLTTAYFNSPSGLAFDTSGNLYIADGNNCEIRKISSGTVSTIAGGGCSGNTGDGGPATSAALNMPRGVAVDSTGNVFISDTQNARIRMIKK